MSTVKETSLTVDSISHPVVLADQRLRVVQVNSAYRAQIGVHGVFEAEERLPDLLRRLVVEHSPWNVPSDDQTAVNQLLLGVEVMLENSRSYWGVLHREREDLFLLHLVSGATSTASALLGPLGDVLRLLEGYEELSDSALIRVDQQGVVLSHNDRLETIGIRGGEGVLVGRPIGECVALTQMGRSVSIDKLLQLGWQRHRSVSYTSEMGIVGVNGTIEVELTIQPVGGLTDPSYAIVAIKSIEEREQIRRDLSNIQHAREIAKVAEGIAHELNNGATALITHLTLITHKMGGVPPTVREELSAAQSAIRKIRRLSMRLERFSAFDGARGTGGERSDEQEVLSSVEFVETLQDTVDLAVSGTGTRASFVIDSMLPAVRIRAAAFSQSLYNVVTNAVEAMDLHGSVHIEVNHNRSRGIVSVVVRDEGHGINPRLIDKVLQPYYTTKENAVGMGLTVALSTLKQFGGSLRIETEPGFGTTVTIEVCEHAAPAVKTEEASGRGDEVDNEGYAGTRVLLVEDDPLVRRSLERTLKTIGCEVVSIDSGDRAIDLLQREYEASRSFDLLITDLAMPGKNDGVQVLRRAREFDEEIPVVLSSGALHRHNISSYRDAGFQYVLRKPFGEPEVRYALAVALAHE